MLVKFFSCLLLLLPVLAFGKPLESSESRKNVCGISPAALRRYGNNSIEKTLEGPASKPGDWPWLVSLETISGDCSATLIGENWVLTAAHCVTVGNTTDDSAEIFAASINDLQGKKYVAEKIIAHPEWNGATHDIALLRVPTVKFNAKIHPICLSSKLPNSPKNNSIGVGWGLTWNGTESQNTGVLHDDIIPIRPWEHCKDLQEALESQTGFPLEPKTQICAGKGMHSVYHGDSGGPLMEIVNNRFYEIGITSMGDPGDDSQITPQTDFEDIFTYVPAYCDWIAETTNGEVKCE